VILPLITRIANWLSQRHLCTFCILSIELSKVLSSVIPVRGDEECGTKQSLPSWWLLRCADNESKRFFLRCSHAASNARFVLNLVLIAWDVPVFRCHLIFRYLHYSWFPGDCDTVWELDVPTKFYGMGQWRSPSHIVFAIAGELCSFDWRNRLSAALVGMFTHFMCRISLELLTPPYNRVRQRDLQFVGNRAHTNVDRLTHLAP
jgi:hypothetical protein